MELLDKRHSISKMSKLGMVLVTCHAYMSSVEKKYLMIVMIVMAKHKTNVKKVNRMKTVVLGFFFFK